MSDTAHLVEHAVSREELLQGVFLHAVRDTVQLPDGNQSVREYLIHPGAVMIIALLEGDDGLTRVVMERQYRHPVGLVMIEFPAGKRDPGEDAKACAMRELREETGYTATHWARAGQIHPVIAYSTEAIDIWFARGVVAGERNLDAGEFLDVFTADLPTLQQGCQSGTITDAKTVSGVLWLHNVLSGAWPLVWETA